MERELFDNPINNTPDTTKRIAFGKKVSITENMTLLSFIAWMYSQLTTYFTKRSNNLSDLADIPTARGNLDVYDIGTIDGMVDKWVNKDTGWKTGTKVSSDVDTASFVCNCAQYGKIVTGNGYIRLTGAPGTAVLFRLPVEVDPPTIDIPFSAGDAEGTSSEIIEMYVVAGTRDVKCEESSQGKVSSYNFNYYT